MQKDGDEEETLEEKIDELRKTLDYLEQDWLTYSERIDRMTVSKLTDPRYPLTDWELHYARSGQQRVELRATLQALQNRLTGQTTAEHERIAIDGVSNETLYAPGPPSFDEALQALRTVTKGPDRTVYEVMQLARDEFDVDYDELANFVLNGIKLHGGAGS